ncbi:hypothetical protein F8M41_011066 [Gigaspora margarita]|uniref:Uncharacterized protein n=1 Tax=Gigaspora margarita TaxID=4874 RepID=A0A8H4A2R4_GIGMA|nr:hypothetical protein F8M41_011066 [Gigaspora margarita]
MKDQNKKDKEVNEKKKYQKQNIKYIPELDIEQNEIRRQFLESDKFNKANNIIFEAKTNNDSKYKSQFIEFVKLKKFLRDIIVYNSEKIKGNKFTPKARIWASTSKQNIKVCNKKEIVQVIEVFFKVEKDNDKDIKYTDLKFHEFRLDQFGFVGKNVSIEKMKTFFIKHKEINNQIRNRIKSTGNPPDNNNRIKSTKNPPDNNNRIQSTRNLPDNNNRIQSTGNLLDNNNRIQSTGNPSNNNNRIQSTRNLSNNNNRIQSTRNLPDNNNRIHPLDNNI